MDVLYQLAEDIRLKLLYYHSLVLLLLAGRLQRIIQTKSIVICSTNMGAGWLRKKLLKNLF